ncbi:helix-turn-helix domain-containing protein [Streptomyces buecherae]|uniref:nSTAND1 domain-containing NTPase n=1 Tax=Streptomyces buecherae TaxID=2763006 RepID=UPI0036B06F6D
MGRPERSIDPEAGPVQQLAWQLRQLRERAGAPSYRVLAEAAHYAASTLAEAAKGERLPSLPVVLAYARACGGDPAEWEARWRQAAREAPRPGVRTGDEHARQEAQNPYPGSAAFERADAEVFTGRSALVDEVARKVERHPVVAVTGASGSGLSSLVRAGLPARMGPDWHLVVLVPGRHPLAALASAVAALTASDQAHTPQEEPTTDPETLTSAMDAWLVAGPAKKRVLLVVDQVEGAFTHHADAAEWSAFCRALLRTSRTCGPRLRIVLAVRSDYQERCLSQSALAAVLPSGARLRIEPPSRDELRSIITEPAARRGAVVEADLLEAVLAESAGQPGALPLVAIALRLTWHRRRADSLRLADYREVGGVRGVATRLAEQAYGGASSDEQALIRSLFFRLTAPGEGTALQRRTVDRSELDGLADPRSIDRLLDRLAEARVITLDGAAAEAAHEAVIRDWPRLRQWLDDEPAALCTHRQLTHAALTWESLAREPGALYRGTQLATVREWAQPRQVLNRLEHDFLVASLAVSEEERRAAGQRARSLRQLAASVSVAVVGGMGAGVFAARARRGRGPGAG